MIYLRCDVEVDGSIIINFINLTPEEKEMVRNWRNHESIRKVMYSDHIISREEHAHFIEQLKEDTRNSYWVVKKKGEHIGTISLNRIDIRNKNAYMGIYTNPGKKISGAGSILIENLKYLAFHVAGLHTLKLEVLQENEQAIIFYIKSGFIEEGRLKEYIFKDNKWSDMVIMGIINNRK